MFDKESFPTNKKNYNKYIHHSENITWIILYLLSSKKYSWNEKTVLDTLLIDKNDYFAIFNFFLPIWLRSFAKEYNWFFHKVLC